jgi:hypothetical protein
MVAVVTWIDPLTHCTSVTTVMVWQFEPLLDDPLPPPPLLLDDGWCDESDDGWCDESDDGWCDDDEWCELDDEWCELDDG